MDAFTFLSTFHLKAMRPPRFWDGFVEQEIRIKLLRVHLPNTTYCKWPRARPPAFVVLSTRMFELHFKVLT